ncbi:MULTISPECIES: hypothetical protein [Arthrobacter]|uniref:hypothetical protein n=1 Tax=unclassified Arthrobacter TaxID=235627 RepID=UPI0024BA0153|nr:hypothetical protein [Arthrobacter sp. H35-MC1]MDJ0316427.1 hypothetical protein [Arthrobacter sp. H35-MC1]
MSEKSQPVESSEMLALVLLAMVPFVWFGLITGISFIETPLKFRAPGMTHALGVGIGRLVFKVLNLIEVALMVVLLCAWTQEQELVSVPAGIFIILAVLALTLQVLVLRPAMNKRTSALADTALTHTGTTAVKAKVATLTHIAYIGLEFLKTVSLPMAGILIILAVAG